MKVNYLSLNDDLRSADSDDSHEVVKNILSDGGVNFLIPAPQAENPTLSVILEHIKGIIAGRPEYISHQEQHWLLAHIDDLMEFCENIRSDKGTHNPYASEIGNFTTMLHATEKDFIYISRAIFLLEFIGSHIYGGSLGYFHRKWKGPVFKEKATVVGFSCGSDLKVFRPGIVLGLQEMRFKSWMAQRHFSRSEIIFTAPLLDAGEYIVNSGIEGVSGLNSGVIEGFYKSKPAGHAMKYLEAIPFVGKSSKVLSHRLEFSFAVFFPTIISAIDASGEIVRLITYVPLAEVIMHRKKNASYVATNYCDESGLRLELLNRAVRLIDFDDSIKRQEHDKLKNLLDDANDRIMKRHLWRREPD